MLDLLAATDAVRRQMQESVTPRTPRPKSQKPARKPRVAAVRAGSAAALRGLAERLEPSPS